jgi:hypothetical protein
MSTKHRNTSGRGAASAIASSLLLLAFASGEAYGQGEYAALFIFISVIFGSVVAAFIFGLVLHHGFDLPGKKSAIIAITPLIVAILVFAVNRNLQTRGAREHQQQLESEHKRAAREFSDDRPYKALDSDANSLCALTPDNALRCWEVSIYNSFKAEQDLQLPIEHDEILLCGSTEVCLWSKKSESSSCYSRKTTEIQLMGRFTGKAIKCGKDHVYVHEGRQFKLHRFGEPPYLSLNEYQLLPLPETERYAISNDAGCRLNPDGTVDCRTKSSGPVRVESNKNENNSAEFKSIRMFPNDIYGSRFCGLTRGNDTLCWMVNAPSGGVPGRQPTITPFQIDFDLKSHTVRDFTFASNFYIYFFCAISEPGGLTCTGHTKKDIEEKFQLSSLGG